MTSVLNTLNYFKKKYEIFNLIDDLHKYVSNYDLSKININENNLDKYHNKKSHKFDIVMFHSQFNESSVIHIFPPFCILFPPVIILFSGSDTEAFIKA